MTIPSVHFQSARTRLALTYLAIIMVLSLGFSFVFYQQSIREASFGLRSQESQLKDYLYFTTPEGVERIRNTQLSAFRLNLLRRLTVLNLGMLIVGGVLSSILAKRSLRPLEETIAAQNRFTSDAAHELRTPLTAMKTEIEVALRDKTLKPAEAKELLTSNLEEVNKLESLIASLLRLAKNDQSTDTSHWQDYRISDILREARIRLADKAASKHMTITLSSSKAIVHGDPDQLTELFVTLLDNAVKYSSENSAIHVKVAQKDTSIKVSITDEGIGISEIDKQHVFERFYRADQSHNRSHVNGYGLGLSLAEAIVKAHNGKISIKSEVGVGSTFTVELPKL
jgi:OmpR-family two-component system manganese-sensing sensor histidine kinase